MKELQTRFKASHRFARITPRKARYVMDQIRGQDINVALNTLRFNRRRGAAMINKVLRSALANVEHSNLESEQTVDTDKLYVCEARVDEGPTMKRWRARARGMVNQILKRTSHLHVWLAPRPDEDGGA